MSHTRTLIIAGALTGLVALSGCASGPTMSESNAMAAPVEFEGLRNPSSAGNTTFAGQPTPEALERYAAEGGAMVIDLRTHEGRDVADFDEGATVEALGMRYVHIPFSSSTFSGADVERFTQALEEADGPVLVHCGSSSRVGGMWATYLATEHGWDIERAIDAGKAAGMGSESVEAAARRVATE